MADTDPNLSTAGNINLTNITAVDPLSSAPGGPASVNEPSRTMIGFRLSKYVLLIISGFILFLVIFLFVNKIDASGDITIPEQINISDSSFTKKLEIIKIVQQEKKSQRDFIIALSQMVLLNLLLPILTAILGYIFASTQNNNSSKNE